MTRQGTSVKEVLGGSGAVLDVEIDRADAAGRAGRAVVLVEGVSDRRAIETLARRRSRRLEGEGIEVIPTAGISNLGRFLELLGPEGHDVELAGLCDHQEHPRVRRALEGAGIAELGAPLERLGFFTCVRDLEDELIRALGPERMFALLEANGDIRRFRSFRNQPAQRHKAIEDQFWRWLGNHKIRYAPLMVDGLDLDRVPRPLESVLRRFEE
jgi:hypothetical protein